ncbi:MAG: hypothetical protein FJW61_09465, partial [Actinobacteria bacterium]|nr:hypothetical protein [Actinomycetota bacterium]
MNPKERVYTVLEHKKPDRVPVTNRFTPEVAGMLSEILNINSDDSFDLEVELGHDLLCTKEIGIVNVFTFKDSRQIDNNLYIDEFGVLKRKIEHGGGSYIEIVKNPLEDLNKFSSYKLPDPDKQPVLQKQLKNFKENVEKYGKTHAIVGGVTATIFEAAQHLRGIERVMVDLIENEDFLNELMDML